MFHNIMLQASHNALKQFEILDRIATNVANVNTNGYKARRFDQYITVDNRLEGVERTDYAPGALTITRRPLDVGIQGEGFLPVTTPQGNMAYTRDGAMARNSDGFLITQFGDLVGEGIQIPANYKELFIRPNGEVQVLESGQITPRTLGRLSLVTFANPEGLKPSGQNKLVATATSGQAQPLEPIDSFKQGMVERSNVNVYYQIDNVLRLNASVISNLRMIKFTDDLYRQAVNLKQ